MKYLKQFGIILFVSLLGEILHAVLPLPIPASIYGLVLMLAALMTGVISLEKVENVSLYLIEIMPVMFIPAGAGLLTGWSVLQPMLVPVAVITVVSTVVVMGITGVITQWLIKKTTKEDGHE